MKLKNKNYQGFSLIESILSMFVLSVGIIAVLELMTSSIGVSIEAKNYNIAISLAQEGIELVRNVRDNDWAGFGSLPNNSNCKIDIDSNSIDDCNNGSSISNRILRLDGNGFYNHTTGSPTRFYRKVGLFESSNQRIVTSMVIWQREQGNNFPGVNNCNEAHHCAYTQVILKDWK